jgi:hypothetical protein
MNLNLDLNITMNTNLNLNVMINGNIFFGGHLMDSREGSIGAVKEIRFLFSQTK